MILKGKVALVTGAGTGIGKAIALGLAGEGADVVVHYYPREAGAREVLAEILALGRKALPVYADLTLAEDALKLVDAAREAFGRIDVLVNNAGLRTIVLCGRERCPVLEMTVADWDRMMAVNIRAPFLLSKAVLPLMIGQGGGSIINISSGAGTKAVPGRSAYTASKHALEGFTKALAGEIKDTPVRVNALAPGGMTNVDGRGGLPVGVIVPAAIYLASDASRHISGETVIAKKWNEAQGIKLTP